jgi:hypothetical protein
VGLFFLQPAAGSGDLPFAAANLAEECFFLTCMALLQALVQLGQGLPLLLELRAVSGQLLPGLFHRVCPLAQLLLLPGTSLLQALPQPVQAILKPDKAAVAVFEEAGKLRLLAFEGHLALTQCLLVFGQVRLLSGHRSGLDAQRRPLMLEVGGTGVGAGCRDGQAKLKRANGEDVPVGEHTFLDWLPIDDGGMASWKTAQDHSLGPSQESAMEEVDGVGMEADVAPFGPSDQGEGGLEGPPGSTEAAVVDDEFSGKSRGALGSLTGQGRRGFHPGIPQ